MRFFIKSAVFIMLYAAFAMHPAGAVANTDQAGVFVQGLGDKVVKVITDTKMNDSQKSQKLEDFFITTVDVDWVAKFVAGRYWREASQEQQKNYIERYKKFLVNSYVSKFKQYTGQKMIVGKSVMESEGEYLVETTIQDADSKSYQVSYKLRQEKDNKFKIYDIIAEGVSMITTQRSEFGSILDREGMDSLIAKLDKKN